MDLQNEQLNFGLAYWDYCKPMTSHELYLILSVMYGLYLCASAFPKPCYLYPVLISQQDFCDDGHEKFF